MQRRASRIVLMLALTLTPALIASAGAKEKVLHRFSGGSDGAYPSSRLLMDAAGNLYGTTDLGGNLNCNNGAPGSGCGVVFELTPSANGKWREKVLYAFVGQPDGLEPNGNLVFDARGNLYGTTGAGGTGTGCVAYKGCGTVFELSPHADGKWTETVLYSFQALSDGEFPAGLTLDAAGNLYGTTLVTAYELLPPGPHSAVWTEKTIYTPPFFLSPGLIFDSNGNLYGDTAAVLGGSGYGVVFQLKSSNGSWTETDLYDFLGGGNGGSPTTGLVFDKKGNLYGTGESGGNNQGIAFELKHSGDQWSEAMLYEFCSLNYCADGAYPTAGLVMDSDALYGTTYEGGACMVCGVVFKLAHTKDGWKETVLYDFRGGLHDGVGPMEPLILDRDGNLYGTASTQSSYSGYGIVFELMQPTASQRIRTLSTK